MQKAMPPMGYVGIVGAAVLLFGMSLGTLYLGVASLGGSLHWAVALAAPAASAAGAGWQGVVGV